MENEIPKYTELELETLFSLYYERDPFIADLFDTFEDQEDLIRKFQQYKYDILDQDIDVSSTRIGWETNSESLMNRLNNFYAILFGDIEILPLHINDKFKKVICYRLRIGK